MFFKMLKNMFGAKSCEKQISDKAADKHENVEVNKNKENTKSGFQNGYYTRSLTIDSILGKRVVVIAIIRNDYLVYDNCYNSSDYEYDEDGDMKFKGPVFKIELSLRNCDQFSIFYGIVTNDREREMMDINSYPQILDEYAVSILKEIPAKCYGIYNLMLFAQAPTRYAYHLYKNSKYYYVTNNRGDDSYYIDIENGTYKRNTRDEILKIIRSIEVPREDVIEYFDVNDNAAPAANLIKGDIRLHNIVLFGSYYFDNNTNTVPIKWRVLAVENGKVLMITEYAIETKPYNEVDDDLITWEKCTLRKWLNTKFFNKAFTKDEQKQVCLTHLRNDNNDEYGTYGGNDTNCKLFVLSIAEAGEYFSDDNDRRCRVSPYAESLYDNKYRQDPEYCEWRLRSPGAGQNNAAAVQESGHIAIGGDYVSSQCEYIRVALWAKI